MRVVLDLTENEWADLQAVSSELASSNQQSRWRLGFTLQRAILAAVAASIKPPERANDTAH
jgi:hypothetical protein